MLDKEEPTIDTVFFPPSICVPDPINSKKMSNVDMGTMGTSRVMWHNPFGHQLTRNDLLGQIDQNVLGQL